MSFITHLACLALVATLCGMAQSQCLSRVRSVVPVQTSPCGEDLTTIVQLARALNEVEGGSCSSASSSSSLNVDDIITKLINALIYATVGGKGSSSGSGGGLLNLGLGNTEVLKLL